MLGVLFGVLFLGIGVSQGQFAVIWQKAVMICMECVGIGEKCVAKGVGDPKGFRIGKDGGFR